MKSFAPFVGVRSLFWLYGGLFTFSAAFIAAVALRFSVCDEDGIATAAYPERRLILIANPVRTDPLKQLLHNTPPYHSRIHRGCFLYLHRNSFSFRESDPIGFVRRRLYQPVLSFRMFRVDCPISLATPWDCSSWMAEYIRLTNLIPGTIPLPR